MNFFQNYSTFLQGICPLSRLFSLFSEHLENRFKTKYDGIIYMLLASSVGSQ
jgi:hypothetical protein